MKIMQMILGVQNKTLEAVRVIVFSLMFNLLICQFEAVNAISVPERIVLLYKDMDCINCLRMSILWSSMYGLMNSRFSRLRRLIHLLYNPLNLRNLLLIPKI